MAYFSQEMKKRVAEKAKQLAKPKGVKVSFRISHHSELIATVTVPFIVSQRFATIAKIQRQHDSGYCYLVKKDEDFALQMHFNDWHKEVIATWGEEYAEFIQSLWDVMNEGNWNNSDCYTDYFDIGWYTSINICSAKSALAEESDDIAAYEYYLTEDENGWNEKMIRIPLTQKELGKINHWDWFNRRVELQQKMDTKHIY